MNVWVYTVARSETVMIPYFLRHYSPWCERVIVYDAGGHDGLFDGMGMHPELTLRPWPLGDHLDDEEFVGFASKTYKEARGHADYVIWVDTDELVAHPYTLQELERQKKLGVDVPHLEGYQLITDEAPTTTGQLLNGNSLVVPDPVYSKPVLFNPEINISWCAGKHGCAHDGKDGPSQFALVHCRFMSWPYVEARNARNHQRRSQTNAEKGYGFHTKPDHVGIYDFAWYQAARAIRKPLSEVWQ